MEKVSAACVVEWSNDLEKGLRSNIPGRRIQSIQLAGRRIEKWSKEPMLKLSFYDIFDMIEGQERLFAGSIVIRLADAFGSGDAATKAEIVKLFLSEKRGRESGDIKNRKHYGIFSKMSTDNHAEILKRIKVALDDGNIKSKELTLILFGCWSEIAKEMPDVRYEILSNLRSPHASVVKASLFAAGCFAEVSHDFAYFFTEMLIKMFASPSTSSTRKVELAWMLRKLKAFHSVILKAYKTGSEIVGKSSKDKWFVTMLISLTKLAASSMTLGPQQVRLLAGLLDSETEPYKHFLVLRSLRFILENTPYIAPASLFMESLLTILKDNEVFSSIRCEALKIVMIAFPVPFDMLNVQEFKDLLPLVVNAAKSPHLTYNERVVATRSLVGICSKVKGRKPIATAELYLLPVLSDLVSSIGGEVVLEMKKMSKYCEASDLEVNFKRLLQLLFLLIDTRAEVFLVLLDQVHSILESLADIRRETMKDTEIDYEVHRVIRMEEDFRFSIASKLVHYAFKQLFGSVQRLHANKEVSRELLFKLRKLVSFVSQCNLFDCSIHVKFSLLLHSCGEDINCSLPEDGNEGEGRFLDRISLPNLLRDGTLNSECIRNMLAGNNVWESYLVGKHAACQGAWVVCDSVFKDLAKRVQSEISFCWLSSLCLFSHSENRFQEMFTRESGHVLVDTSGILSQLDDYQRDILTSKGIEVLSDDTCDILQSEIMLRQTTLLKQKFCFQRWFLALRAKVLAVIFDLHKLLGAVLLNQESTQTNILTQEDDVKQVLARLSRKAHKIAREYDLMNSSFINIDHRSFRVITSLALSCSLLAFCIGLAYFTPEKSCTSQVSGGCLHTTVVEDLVGRISYLDHEICMSIFLIFKGDDAHEASLRSRSKSRSHNIVYQASEGMLTACRAAVRRLTIMRGHDDCSLPVILNERAHFLLDFTKEWMSIPFHIPKFFFLVRPCIGASLYIHEFNSESTTDVSVLSGSTLQLRLCLQLKSIPQEQLSRITKVFCILHCRKSTKRPSTKPSEADTVDYASWTTDSMMLLQERLMWHVIQQGGKKSTRNDAALAETFVCFEMNGGVQGLASCFLDVSALPVGSYQIDWLSCCIDDSSSYWSFLPRSPSPFFSVRSS